MVNAGARLRAVRRDSVALQFRGVGASAVEHDEGRAKSRDLLALVAAQAPRDRGAAGFPSVRLSQPRPADPVANPQRGEDRAGRHGRGALRRGDAAARVA